MIQEDSEVDGIDVPVEDEHTPSATNSSTDELLMRVLLELAEVKTSLAVLHLKFNDTLTGRIGRWLAERK